MKGHNFQSIFQVSRKEILVFYIHKDELGFVVMFHISLVRSWHLTDITIVKNCYFHQFWVVITSVQKKSSFNAFKLWVDIYTIVKDTDMLLKHDKCYHLDLDVTSSYINKEAFKNCSISFVFISKILLGEIVTSYL